MTKPSDDRRLGSFFDWDSFCSGNGAASNRRGVIGDGMSKLFGQIGIAWMKRQKLQNRPVEIFDVFGLGLASASGGGFLLFDKRIGRAFNFKFGPSPFNDCRWCPNAP